ncbi:MAG: hypothetical protein AAF436_00400 [Myxococcota bacterium]
MLYHYLIGVGSVVLLFALWIRIQRAWKRSFSEVGSDPDALAGRSGCRGCIDPSTCNRTPNSGACMAREEKS